MRPGQNLFVKINYQTAHWYLVDLFYFHSQNLGPSDKASYCTISNITLKNYELTCVVKSANMKAERLLTDSLEDFKIVCCYLKYDYNHS